MPSSAPRRSSSPTTRRSSRSPIGCCSSPTAASPRREGTRRAAPRPSSRGDRMHALDIKLLRDLRRLWPQALAIALVLGGAVATFVLSIGTIRSLEETRATYYDRYQFADVFPLVKRAPKGLADRIAEIPGVAAAEARIAKFVLLDIPGFREPATAEFVSLPDAGAPRLNRLYMRSGRTPEPGRTDEVVVNEGFATAH